MSRREADQASLVSSCTRRRRKTELEKLLEAQSCSSVVSEVVDLGKRKRNSSPSDWCRPRSKCVSKRRRARSATRPRNLTDKRKSRILEFIKKAFSHPVKYGVYGSARWINNVISYINGNVYRVTHDDVRLWLHSNPIFNETHLKLSRSKRASDESSSSTSARPGPSRSVMKPSSTAASRTPPTPVLKESCAPDARQTVEPEPEPEPPKKLMKTIKAKSDKVDEIPAAITTRKEKDDAIPTMKPNEAISGTNASGACADPGNESSIPTPVIVKVERKEVGELGEVEIAVTDEGIPANIETEQSEETDEEVVEAAAAGADEGRAPLQGPRTGLEHLMRIKEHCLGIMKELAYLRIIANAGQQVPGINLSVVQAVSSALIEVVNNRTGN